MRLPLWSFSAHELCAPLKLLKIKNKKIKKIKKERKKERSYLQINCNFCAFVWFKILYFMNKKGIFGLGVDCRIYRVNWKWKSFPLSLFENSTITSCQIFFCFPYKITKILNGKNKTHDIILLVKYKIEHKKKDIWFLHFSKN